MMAFRSLGLALALTAAALSIALFEPASGAAPDNKDGPKITAPHAILIDGENGSVLWERDADKLIFPASLGKLMTAEYVFHLIEERSVNIDDEYRVSENAWRKGGAPSHGSTMFAQLGSKVSVDNLLHGMIIQSANDACIVLAEAIAGNEAEFGRKLTERAREIGLAKSVFTNSNGLPDPGEQVTTRELALLARHIILNYPDFYKLFGEKEFTWNNIRQQNRNPLLAMLAGADGLKTGFTKEAGYGLVGSAVQDNLRLIVVINGAKTAKERAEDAKKLLEWGFRNFEKRVLFAQGVTLGSAKVFGGADGHVPLQATGPVTIMVPKAGGERLIARIVYQGPVPAPIKEGQRIGNIKVWRNNQVVLEQPLHAAAPIEKGNISQRALDAVSELVIALFRAGAQKL
jgi:serine-type D-Ala-D-Ala carboxypeptidase (penicillin-binding protein 5/6)